jgi:2-phospho-L-lactate guanylyltransferase
VATILCALPIKPFTEGKERLAGVLAQPQRSRLSRIVAASVVAACRDGGGAVAVVTGSPEVRRWAAAMDVESINEPAGGGLDGAATAAAVAAVRRGAAFAVVHADLPLLTPADVAAVIGALRPGGVVLAPSRDGGTNVLAATEPLRFSYGPGSFRRHLAEAAPRSPVVIVRPGLCIDLDGPDDAAAVAARPEGAWIGTLLGDAPDRSDSSGHP